MKIVWLSNLIITEDQINSSGGWITEMYRNISLRDDIEICNLGLYSGRKLKQYDLTNGQQYAVPANGLWDRIETTTNKQIINIIKKCDPDIIHLWGTETKWSGFLNKYKQLFPSCPILLEIQGVMSACEMSAFEGMSIIDRIKSIGILDFAFPHMSIFGNYSYFRRLSKLEKKILIEVSYVNTQSDYVRRWMRTLTNAEIFETSIILRKEFVEGRKWKMRCGQNVICAISSRSSIKGLHTTIRAFALIKKQYPELRLKIAGVKIYKFANFGYVRFLKKIARELKIEDSIEWVGYLNSQQILDLYDESFAYINSSSCESYCLSLAEALSYGIPCIVSYSAALSEMAIDNETALVFPKNDYVIAASKIRDIFDEVVDVRAISTKAIYFMEKKNKKDEIVENQYNIYKKIIK